MPISVGDLSTNGGNVNLNEAGHDVMQIAITGNIDINQLKALLDKDDLLADYSEKVDSLETGIKDKDNNKVRLALGFLLKVAENATTKWLATTLIKLF